MTNKNKTNMTETNESMGMDMEMSSPETYRERVYGPQKTDIKLKLLEKVLLDQSIKAERYKEIVKQIEEATYIDELSIIIEIANS